MTIIRTVFMTALLGMLFSCNDYLDINDNPNVATRPPLDGLLATTTYETGYGQFRISDGHAAYFVQYLASPNQSSTVDIYEDISNGSAWSAIYNTMTNIYDMIRFAEEDNSLQHAGIGKVLMAINLATLVDNWGDVPYSDAFTGEVLRPTYDSGEDLYQEVFKLLNEAESTFENLGDSPNVASDKDLIHGGDIDKWLKTINALRARYWNHYSELSSYDPDAVLDAISNSYESSDDNAWITEFRVRGPWAQVARNNDNLLLDGWLSAQFVDAMNGNTFGVFDPRLPLLTDTTMTGDYNGTVNGEGRQGDGTGAVESYLEQDGAKSNASTPLPIITYTELKFIEAEAALATGDQSRANDAFIEGVYTDMFQVGVDSSSATAYLQDAYDVLDGGDIDLDDIMREKYNALFLQAETWVDARRYDYMYTDMTLATNAVLSSFPTRLQYPSTELDRNSDNTPEVTLLDKIFWDQ